MNVQTKSPESNIAIIKAIDPIEGDDRLVYPGLQEELEAQRATLGQRWQLFEDAPDGSVQEAKAAAGLAGYYLLKTADQLTTGAQTDALADHYTKASEELFDIEPDKPTWQALHNHELQTVREYGSNEHATKLLALYHELGIDSTETSTSNVEFPQINPAWGEYIVQRYGRLLDQIDPETTYTSEMMVEAFQRAMHQMIELEADPGWSDWDATLTESDKLSVAGGRQRIEIGRRRAPELGSELRELVAHELLDHALRAQRARAAGRPELVRGLDGYNDAEEGLGVVAEAALGGGVPEKAADRYHDLGLALGLYGGRQLARPELTEIARLRVQMRNPNMSATEAHNRAAAHVNRMYRGGPGRSSEHVHQAIFVRDMMYFTGYQKMAPFINERLNHGQPVTELFDWLMQGKFDPTNEAHVAFVDGK